MNYLALCQRVRQEVGYSGSDSTVVAATGDWKRICDWTAQAWVEIQESQDAWEWMWVKKSFNTVTNQGEYPYASAPLSLTDFARWRDKSFRIYKSSIGDEHLLDQRGYVDFRNTFLIGTSVSTYAYPHAITVSPSDSLILALPPDGVYTVTGEYYTTPSELSADADIPEMPSRYHMLIVYRAMQSCGLYESATELVQHAAARYVEMMANLMHDELEELSVDRSFGEN